mmetsp:Transcript_5317/g.15054  ORF Transcript_5317/g.15054 Transcript_5317/m.15054 type:complete len:293 (+) Transcript_5317:44-922(+)
MISLGATFIVIGVLGVATAILLTLACTDGANRVLLPRFSKYNAWYIAWPAWLLSVGLIILKGTYHHFDHKHVDWREVATIPLKVAKGTFYTFAAAFLLTSTWNQALTYVHFVLTWWLTNKLSPTRYSASPAVSWLTSDRRLIQYIDTHDAMGHRSWESLHAASEEEKKPWVPTMEEHSLLGGSIVTQYMIFGTAIDVNLHDQEFASAALHLCDDFSDRAEDKVEGTYNYFNNAPEAVPLETWLQRLCEIHSSAPPDFARFIRGSLSVVMMFDTELKEIVHTAYGDKMHLLSR